MDENEMREARTRAAIRVARRLGADTDQLHDVMLAMRSGRNPEVDKYEGEVIGEVLRDTCDEAWQDRGDPYAPARSRMVCELLGVMWPDVLLDCAPEEEQMRKESERRSEAASTAEEYAKAAQHFEQRGDVNRAKLYREAAAVMARTTPR